MRNANRRVYGPRGFTNGYWRSDDRPSADPGETIPYSISIQNAGTTPLAGTQIRMTVPSGVTSATLAPIPPRCRGPIAFTLSAAGSRKPADSADQYASKRCQQERRHDPHPGFPHLRHCTARRRKFRYHQSQAAL